MGNQMRGKCTNSSDWISRKEIATSYAPEPSPGVFVPKQSHNHGNAPMRTSCRPRIRCRNPRHHLLCLAKFSNVCQRMLGLKPCFWATLKRATNKYDCGENPYGIIKKYFYNASIAGNLWFDQQGIATQIFPTQVSTRASL